MTGHIEITVHEQPDGSLGVDVTVSGDLSTMEAVGLFDIAKLQHLDSKRTTRAVVHVAAGVDHGDA